jgi:hypothetical protein
METLVLLPQRDMRRSHGQNLGKTEKLVGIVDFLANRRASDPTTGRGQWEKSSRGRHLWTHDREISHTDESIAVFGMVDDL